MSSLSCLFKRLTINNPSTINQCTNIVRNFKYVVRPRIGSVICYRRKVHYPEEYTVEPLNVTNMGGRDPKTGRVAVGRIGGGIKHKYHWIEWKREGPKEGPPQKEKVLKIIKDGCRTANVALVAVGDKLKYMLATENMKEGDIIVTSMHIPRIPVRANEGDAYPLGALPVNTIVHNVEMYPGKGGMIAHAAGTFATIVRKTPDNKVVIKTPSKREFALPQECMCTVGRLSNIEHGSTPIGSAQRSRELGIRPKSGLWHRKDGYCGRKIRKPPALRIVEAKEDTKRDIIQLELPQYPIQKFQYLN